MKSAPIVVQEFCMMLSAALGRHGVFVHDERDQVIGQSLRLYGEWAEEEIYLISHLIRFGDTVFDVGANVGTHTIPLSRMVGASGTVISIDGQASASALLSLNISMNGADNVFRIEGLAGRKAQVLFDNLNLDGPVNMGAVTFRDLEASIPSEAAVNPQRPIAMFTLDSLQSSICRLIKIDVEGMELDVLTGALHTLSAHRPFVYFEQASNLNFPEIYSLLRSMTYRLYLHAANPFNTNNYGRSAENVFGGTREINVLAVPAEIDFVPPSVIKLEEVVSRDYDFPQMLVPAGWTLPDDAYTQLAPVLPRLAVSIPPELSSDGALGYHFQNLVAKYKALLNDRVLAQRVMEQQAVELATFRR